MNPHIGPWSSLIGDRVPGGKHKTMLSMIWLPWEHRQWVLDRYISQRPNQSKINSNQQCVIVFGFAAESLGIGINPPLLLMIEWQLGNENGVLQNFTDRERWKLLKSPTMKTFTLCQKYIENCSVILWTLLRPKYLKYCSGYFGSSHWVYTADMKTVKTHYGKRAPLSAQLCAVHCSLLRCLQFIQPQFNAIQFSATKRNSVVNQKTIVS